MQNDRKPIVLLDLDDTLAKFCKQIVVQLSATDRKLLPQIVCEETLLQTIWNLKTVSTNDSETAHSILKRIYQTTLNFFRDLEPMEGVLSENGSILDFLQQNGFEVYICSSPDVINATCASDKIAWVNQHFGRFFANRVILTKDKTLIHGDVLVDDNHNVRGAVQNPSWKHLRFVGHAPKSCKEHHENLDRNETTTVCLLDSWTDRSNVLKTLQELTKTV